MPTTGGPGPHGPLGEEPSTTGSSTTRREVLALLVGAFAAGVGALIVGEYEFAGLIPFVAGALFGLAIAELMLTIAVRSTVRLAVAGALFTGGGLAWAAWISSGQGVAPYPAGGYIAIGLGTVIAGGWIAMPSRRHL